MTQFERAVEDQIVCDLCGGPMLPMYGAGFDNDRMICGNMECFAEIIYPTSTEISGPVK